MHTALYRKYRPWNFDGVVGQDHIVTVLKGEVATGRIAHSYLMTGSRGTGKTSCAKILAKAVNCLNPVEGNPCGACENCTAIDRGNMLDVQEIDAASNSRVDDMREVLETALYTPVSGKYRVYIIDEVHMLSVNAFNALLKIMEEPPAHVLFILATTEIHKVLPTIISRCQRFDFRRITSSAIGEHLQYICREEEIDITPEGALTLALLAEGGMRDALSLLEVCSASGAKITPELVNQCVGLVGYDTLVHLVDQILNGDLLTLLQSLDQLLIGSTEPATLCDSLLKHYRNLLLTKTIDNPESLLSCLPSFLTTLREQSGKMSLSSILDALGILMEVKAVIGRSTTKRMELEVALVRLMEQPKDSVGGNEELTQRVMALERRVETLIKEGVVLQQQTNKPLPNRTTAPTSVPKPVTPPTPPTEVIAFREWKKVQTILQKVNPAIGGMLLSSNAYTDGKRVLIDIQNPVLLTMLKENDVTRNTIKRSILEATGKNYGIGPYRKETMTVSEDPFRDFLGKLPENSVITVTE